MSKMNENDWELVDMDSRNLITEWLKKIGAKNIKPTKGNCCIDLLFDTSKHHFAVEIKDRSFASSRYGDVFAEEYKQVGSLRRMENGQFEKAIAINVFTDGVFAISNLFHPKARHI